MPERVLALLNGGLADPDAPLPRGDGVLDTMLVVTGVALERAALRGLLSLPAVTEIGWLGNDVAEPPAARLA